MFYILASRVFLQILLYNTMIDATAEQTKDNKQNIIKYDFEDLKSKLKENTEQYKHCETLYGELVVLFLKNYKVQQSFIDCNCEKFACKFVLQDRHEIEAFNKLCIQHIKDNFGNHKISENEQMIFNYHAELFLNSVEFVIKTFDEIMKLKKDFSLNSTTTIEKISENGKLMKRLMLSCDWIQKIKDNTNFTFLYNFDTFTPDEINATAVSFDYSILMRPSSLDNRAKTYLVYVQEYLKEKKFDTLQDMLAIEKVQKIIDWFNEKQKTYDARNCKEILYNILKYIISEKSFNTKIDYIAKKGYYNINDEGFDVKQYDKSEELEIIMRSLKLEETFPNFYKLNISAYRMYSRKTILSTTSIIELINNKIDEVMKNANEIIIHYAESIKTKICNVVQEHEDAIPFVALESICDMIHYIKNPSIQEFKNALKTNDIKHISKKILSIVMNILSIYKEPYILLIKPVDVLIAEIDKIMLEKYSEFIINLKKLYKIQNKNKKMKDKLKVDMLKIKLYDILIGKKDKDAEDIYLGLHTSKAYYKNITKSYQNERKLCELRIIEIMKNVITYKRMIIKTENSMFELMNKIEALNMQSKRKFDCRIQ